MSLPLAATTSGTNFGSGVPEWWAPCRMMATAASSAYCQYRSLQYVTSSSRSGFEPAVRGEGGENRVVDAATFLAAEFDLAQMRRQESPVGNAGCALDAGGAERVGEFDEQFASRRSWHGIELIPYPDGHDAAAHRQ